MHIFQYCCFDKVRHNTFEVGLHLLPILSRALVTYKPIAKGHSHRRRRAREEAV